MSFTSCNWFSHKDRFVTIFESHSGSSGSFLVGSYSDESTARWGWFSTVDAGIIIDRTTNEIIAEKNGFRLLFVWMNHSEEILKMVEKAGLEVKF